MLIHMRGSCRGRTISEGELAVVIGVLANPVEVAIEQVTAEQDAMAAEEIDPAADADADPDQAVGVREGTTLPSRELAVDVGDEGKMDMDGGVEKSRQGGDGGG